jgi:hypothetical protein
MIIFEKHIGVTIGFPVGSRLTEKRLEPLLASTHIGGERFKGQCSSIHSPDEVSMSAHNDWARQHHTKNEAQNKSDKHQYDNHFHRTERPPSSENAGIAVLSTDNPDNHFRHIDCFEKFQQSLTHNVLNEQFS